MPRNSVIFREKEHVAHIILNRIEAKNAINQRLAHDIKDLCNQINQKTSVYAVIITGAGEAFCCGNELEQSLASGDFEISPVTFTTLIKDYSLATSVASINKPVIAAINGDALGQGLELTLSCDIRIASNRAHFSLPQVGMGLIPMDGGTQRLPRIVGRGKALELILTAKTIDAQEALAIGLVNKVVAKEELKSEVEAVAKAIATKGPVALRYAKEAINRGMDLPLNEGLRLEADLYSLLQTTYDRQEGITAYLEKRPPQFKGQ